MLALPAQRATIRSFMRPSRRTVSTLTNNKHIYVFPDRRWPSRQILSLLPSDPPAIQLALGTTTTIPPTPDSFSENPHFLEILQQVLKEHACHDPEVKAQAATFLSTAGAFLGSGGSLFVQQHRRRHESGRGGAGGDGAGGASGQGGEGGAGGGGQGGWVHVSDSRNVPEYGRIAWPEDIFGSLYVNSNGDFEGETGEYQASGTYRIVTREGILGLSDFLRDRLVERLKREEALANGTGT